GVRRQAPSHWNARDASAVIRPSASCETPFIWEAASYVKLLVDAIVCPGMSGWRRVMFVGRPSGSRAIEIEDSVSGTGFGKFSTVLVGRSALSYAYVTLVPLGRVIPVSRRAVS